MPSIPVSTSPSLRRSRRIRATTSRTGPTASPRSCWLTGGQGSAPAAVAQRGQADGARPAAAETRNITLGTPVVWQTGILALAIPVLVSS
jgi:hypothetical protein